jgi:HPt (histidine-containing phosphotransfer) domain-containing protein
MERNYKVINLEYLNEVADGDVIFMLEMINAFLALGHTDIGDLVRFFEDKNWKAVSETAHKLKSASESMGVGILSSLAREIEFKIRTAGFSNDALSTDQDLPKMVSEIGFIFRQAMEEFKKEQLLLSNT